MAGGGLGTRRLVWAIVAVVALFVGLQVWAAYETSRQAERILEEAIESEELESATARQEFARLRIETERDTLFWRTLLTSLLPLATVVVALIGALPSLRTYLEGRAKERSDRAAGELNEVLKNLVSDNARERAFGVVGLQHFLAPGQEEFHLRALTALATAARTGGESEDADVVRSVRIAAERAAANLPHHLLREVSWQYANLHGATLTRLRAPGIDFRDATLENADLSGSDLAGARFDAAKLKGIMLGGANLSGAVLRYADLAGADLTETDLRGAVLAEAFVWRMDVRGADLRGAVYDPDDLPWDLVVNWRDAKLDDGVRERLLERYGPEPAGARVLMLMWEVPPLVAGGTWTACYHLVRRLRVAGANVTVAVPWERSAIASLPFGADVDVVPLGIRPPAGPSTPYEPAPAAWSPYAPSPYASFSGSPYATGWGSPYGGTDPAPGNEGRAPLLSTLVQVAHEFRRRLLALEGLAGFEVVHAHDWITFQAANAVGRPWVAHLHSTVADRQPGALDTFVEHLEGQGVEAADRIVVPSRATAAQVERLYGASPQKVTVAPNPIAPEPPGLGQVGSFETKVVVFLGRLTRQKGPDLFLEVARVLQDGPDARFLVYGSGEDESALRASAPPNVTFRGWLEWERRGAAFAGASAVVVPSRFEPFGMTVAEAMLHRVPVLYPESAGIAEVVDAGIRIRPEDVSGIAGELRRLLSDWSHWQSTVEAQASAMAAYVREQHELEIADLWAELRQPVEREPAS